MPPQFLQLLLTFKRRDWFSEQSVWLRCSRGRTHLLYRSLGAVACKHMHSHAYSTHAQILPRPRGSFYVSVTKYYTDQRETHFVWIQGGGQEGRIEGTKGTTVARAVKHIVEVFRGVKCWTTYPITSVRILGSLQELDIYTHTGLTPAAWEQDPTILRQINSWTDQFGSTQVPGLALVIRNQKGPVKTSK